MDKTVNVHAAISILCDNNLFTYMKTKQAGHDELHSLAKLLFKFAINNTSRRLMFLVLPCRIV